MRFLVIFWTILLLSGCLHTAINEPALSSLSPDELSSFIQIQKDKVTANDENLEAHYFLAVAYFQKKLYFQAEKHAQRATQLAPLVGRYFELAGDVAVERERYGVALNAFKSAVRVTPDLLSGYLKLGLVYEKIDDLNRAISSLEEVIQKDPYYLEAFYHLARLNLKRREYDAALQAIQEALVLEPNNPEAQLLQIRIHIARGSYFHARILAEALRKNSNPPHELDGEWLRILFLQQKFDEALKHIETVSVVRHLSLDEQFLHSRILSAMGKDSEAKQMLQNLLKESPLYTNAMIDLAIVAIREGALEEALTWLNQAIEINDRLVQAHFLQAAIFFKIGNFLQGDLSLNRTLSLDPSNLTYQLLSLRRNLIKGKFAFVEEKIQELNKKFVLNPEILRIQADLAIARSQYPAAETLLRQIQVIENSDLLQFALAQTLYYQGKYRGALAITQSLIQKKLIGWEAIYLHASILNRLGQFKEAQAQILPLLASKKGEGFLHRLAGDLYRYQNQEKTAQQTYRDGLDLFPNQIYLVEALSSSYISTKEWVAARELIKGALEDRTPLDAILLDRLVQIYDQLQDIPKKQDALQRYHQLTDPILTDQSLNIEKRALFRTSSLLIDDHLLNFSPETVQ